MARGGFLIIPAPVLLLKIPIKNAVETLLTIISANSLFGFVNQKFGSRVNEKILKQSFGYFVLLVRSFVLIDQLLKLK